MKTAALFKECGCFHCFVCFFMIDARGHFRSAVLK